MIKTDNGGRAYSIKCIMEYPPPSTLGKIRPTAPVMRNTMTYLTSNGRKLNLSHISEALIIPTLYMYPKIPTIIPKIIKR